MWKRSFAIFAACAACMLLTVNFVAGTDVR